MIFTYKGTKVYYKIVGKGEPIVFLHGWQSNMDAFALLSEELKFQYKCILVDFPPFGKSENLRYPWGIDDYSDMVFALLNTLNINKFNILAHSFGGRVAINLCTCYNDCVVKKMILTGSAGLKPKRNLFYYYKILKYKIQKNKNKSGRAFANFGSQDYRVLSPLMQQTFVKIVNFHQDSLSKKIKCPTLLIFGDKDRETPLYMAKRLKKYIKNSNLIVFKDCGHFCFLNQHELFFDYINNFLKLS